MTNGHREHEGCATGDEWHQADGPFGHATNRTVRIVVMSDPFTHYDAVEVYGGALSALPGEMLDLHVRCSTASYDVTVERVSGTARAVVWRAEDLAGVAHPTPADADANGCRWPVAVRVPIGADWPSGVYLVTCRAHGAVEQRALGHALFAVRAPRPTAPVLLVLATNTYNAYNAWGGRSLYTGGHQVSFERPFIRGLLRRADAGTQDRKSPPCAPGDEPDVDGLGYLAYREAHDYPPSIGSTGWHTYERRFVEWADRNGITYDVAVSEDLSRTPSAAAGYRLVVGVGHDEYWSAEQRDGLERFIASGGNAASFSGNTMFWQVRFDATRRQMTAHKYRAHLEDPVLGTPDEHRLSGMWCDPLVGRPEWSVLGAGSAYGLYSRFGRSTPRSPGGFTVFRDDHWMFAGTGMRYGDMIGARHGVVGYETVGCRLTLDEYGLPISVTPDAPPTEVVAWAPASNLGATDYPAGSVSFTGSDQVDLAFVATRLYGGTDPDAIARVRHGNAVMLTCRPFEHGGEVVTVGSTDWVFGLDDPVVDRITRNIMERLASRDVDDTTERSR